MQYAAHLVQPHINTYTIKDDQKGYSYIICGSYFKLLVIGPILPESKGFGFQCHCQQVSVSDSVDEDGYEQWDVPFNSAQYPTTFQVQSSGFLRLDDGGSGSGKSWRQPESKRKSKAHGEGHSQLVQTSRELLDPRAG